MKSKLAIALGLIITVMSGCITSLNPLYTDKDIIFKKELIGTWQDSKTNESWTFEKWEENGYKLVHKEEGEQATFRAVLVKIGDYMFLDLYPMETASKNSLKQMHQFPVHSFSKVTLSGNSLSLEMLNPEWLDKGLATESLQVQHSKTSDGRIILTATTSELQSFMLAHASMKEAFDEPLALTKK
jgi:hypothetical protein